MPVNKAFLEEIEKQIEERNKLDFFILVWGSGKSNQLAFKKRKKMVELLSKEFKRENVIMSEDKGLQHYTRRLGDIVSESVQVDAADFIIILDTSLGPHLEAQEYFHKISHKCIVICSDYYAKETSFAANLRYKYNLNWFKDEEFKECKMKMRDDSKALEMLNKTLFYFEKTEDILKQGDVYTGIAGICNIYGNINKTVVLWHKALILFEKAKNIVAEIYFNSRNIEKAPGNYHKLSLFIKKQKITPGWPISAAV